MKNNCHKLHRWANSLPKFQFPFDEQKIPQNGIYILFEKGETAHGASRIVRIGTHTGKNQLRSRFKQHFLTENKDRSIFRKNIGRCVLNREKDPFLAKWELDLTTKVAKDMHSKSIDQAKLKSVEKKVTDYIQNNFSFVVIEVDDKDERLELESKMISTVSLCPDCKPSKKWFGNHSPKEKIRQSGLWLVNELYKTPLSDEDLGRLRLLTGH